MKKIFSEISFHNFNNNIATGHFPHKLKLADVSPVFKNGCTTDISNYQPISILPVISKVYERLVFYQVNKHFDPIFSKYQCGFRKGYSTQYCMILLVEKWKRSINTRGCAGTLLTDMSLEFFPAAFCGLKSSEVYLKAQFSAHNFIYIFN